MSVGLLDENCCYEHWVPAVGHLSLELPVLKIPFWRCSLESCPLVIPQGHYGHLVELWKTGASF